jgi:hypothetical protein
MNKAALRRAVTRVEKAVQAPGQIFDMSGWGWEATESNNLFEPGEVCGTAGCLAFYAVPKEMQRAHLQAAAANDARGYPLFSGGLAQKAAQKLGLSDDQQHLLYATCHWPKKFRAAYEAAAKRAAQHKVGTKRRLKAELAKVKALRDRIEHFIETNGDE